MKTLEALITSPGTADLKELLHLSQSALHILLILVLAWILLRLSRKAIWMLQIYSTHHTDNNLEGLKRIETLSRVFRYTSSVVIYVVAGMVSELGVSIAPILATAGVLGIAVGFAAQNLIKDYFNGIFLLLGKSGTARRCSGSGWQGRAGRRSNAALYQDARLRRERTLHSQRRHHYGHQHEPGIRLLGD